MQKMRLDAEYWLKAFIRNERFLTGERLGACCLPDAIDTVQRWPAPQPFEYLEISGVGLSGLSYSTTPTEPTDIPLRAKYLLRENDIAVSTVRPNRNAVALIGASAQPIVASSGFAILRVDPTKVDPAFVFAFCKSSFFATKLVRENAATMYPAVTEADVYDVRLTLPSLQEQGLVATQVRQAQNALNKAHSLYAYAEAYLLECLGMQDFAANPDAYNVKTLKDSFLESGRIDAEYYLPKYEDYVNAVSLYSGGVAPLGRVCTIKDSNYTPKHGTKYRYIELANIGISGDITSYSYENGEDLPTRARRIVTKGDVIVSSIEGSLSSCALITDEYDRALCSTGFYVVRSSRINPETLLTLFKAPPMQQLLRKGCSGTILTGIAKQEFEKIPLPLIRAEVQEEIAAHVRRSFALRREAAQLLADAKRKVENAIAQPTEKLH